MTAPAALCFSKLMYPEMEEVEVTKDKIQKITMKFDSVLDAAIKGASEASQVVIAIIANLIAFIAFIYFINGVLSWLGMLVGTGRTS
jgi:pyrimidine nucleoside transport protein